MREVWGFILNQREVGAERLAEVAECTGIAPVAGSIICGFETGDSRIQRLLALLESRGLRPFHTIAPGKSKGEYSLSVRRDYTEHDLDQYQYLRVCGYLRWPGGDRDKEGCLRIAKPSLPKRRRPERIYDANNYQFISNRGKAALEAEGLRHLLFRPLVLMEDYENIWISFTPPVSKPRDPPPRRLEWSEVGEETWWEMTSDLVLPPVSPSVVLHDGKGGTSERVFGVSMDELSRGELTYRDEDLRRVEPFDAALTVEQWGAAHESYRHLIVSQRFRQAARRNGLSIQFYVPVHVEGRPEPDNLDPPEKTPVEEYVEAPPDGEEEY